ncbi:hypothetical protein [Kineococcus sp. SYSU DK001]|uniref:hypothetical protein n=1 Tax=Kineococcus sp. SYSU DK001 TaxID=3383122 RepID=UPI003D7DB84A
MTLLVGLASLLGLSFVSALTPFVNAEAALVATQALEEPVPVVPAALVAAAGQMGAKYLYFRLGYWRSSRKGKALPRWQEKLNAWSEAALSGGRWRGVLVIGLSSSIGLPPLLLVSVSAGLARVRTLDFLVVGVAGRFLRFLAILLGAGTVLDLLHVPGLG